MERNRKASAVHKPLNHVLQGVRNSPRTRVYPLYTLACLPCCLKPFLPFTLSLCPSSSFPTLKILSPKSLQAHLQTHKTRESTKVKTVFTNFSCPSNFCSSSSTEDQLHQLLCGVQKHNTSSTGPTQAAANAAGQCCPALESGMNQDLRHPFLPLL